MVHSRSKIEIEESRRLCRWSRWHGLGTAPCEVLGGGSGFERCAPIVLKTIDERGDQPRAVLFVVQYPITNPLSLIDKTNRNLVPSPAGGGKTKSPLPLGEG